MLKLNKIIISLFVLSLFYFFVPGQFVFAATFVSGFISSDTTWTIASSTYIVQGLVTINPGVTLSIESGVVVKFGSYPLAVNGTLNVNGTPANKVYFTSIKDDSVGGDTDGDGGVFTPASQDWTHIQFNPGSSGNLNNTIIRYAGKVWCGNDCFGLWDGVYNNGGNLNISNSWISDNNQYGIIQQSGGTLMVTNSEINNQIHGIFLNGGSASISGSNFHDNSNYGIYTTSNSESLILNNNNFSNNSLGAGFIDEAINFTHSGNTASGTGLRGFVMVNIINADHVWNPDLPYLIVSYPLTVGIGKTLTIEPGTVIKFDQYYEIVVNGNLNVSGTPANKVFFTSLKDDSVAGDTNGDGNVTSPASQDWTHIQFNPGSSGNITNAVIHYAGRIWCGMKCHGLRDGIYNNGSSLNISNSQISDNNSYGIIQHSGSLTLLNSEIKNNSYGAYFSAGTANLSQNSFHDNSDYAVFNSSPITISAQNNWWGSESGPYHPTLNHSGTGNRVSDNVDFIPWLRYDPSKPRPSLSNLGQFKSDGLTEISEGNITTEESVVFKAKVNSPSSNQIKLQVELKKFDQLFDESGIIESDFVAFDSVASVATSSLSDGNYKWRARAVDDKENKSDWQEFGVAENMDFEVKLVPLYTQVRSPFPSDDETKIWAELDYAQGLQYNCGTKIRQCGCAITSVVMIARYYDVTETQGKDVNPGNINEWLKNEPSGYVNGDVNWIVAAKYADYRIKYEKTDKSTNNYALLDEKLNNNQPLIVKENAGRGGINRQHFLVVDNKLASTYTVKDPAWYNTQKLDEITNSANKIRGYENGFDGLRIYKKGNGIAQAAITFALGSPAELLITDSLGRRIGKDKNGIEYEEIPNSSYFQDGFDDPAGENPLSQERNKLIQILEPINGEYNLQVIGTGEGDYSLTSNFYDTQGNVNHQEFHSETAPGYSAQYNLSFDSANSSNTAIELFDETPPEAEVSFNPQTQKLIIKGTDNTTVNPIVSLSEIGNKVIYQIQDEAGNISKLVFEKLKQEGKQIKAELKTLQYNNEPIIELPKTELKYEWSLDKSTGQIKELEQLIKVKGNFDIKAKYNHQKNEIEIKIKQEDKEEIKQTLSGLKIVKMITKSGILNFQF